jgi:hypothetical protein
MEPRGCQLMVISGKSRGPQERRKQAKTVAVGCDRFRGKEGVDGSSPSEGLYKSPANGLMLLSAPTKFEVAAGTRRVHFGTGGHSRASAPSRDTSWNVLETVHCGHSLGKLLQIGSWRCPPRRDADSLLRLEGVSERATHAEGELLGAEWSTPLPRKASINPTRKAAERKRLRYDRMTGAPSERSDRNSPSRWRFRPLSPVTGAASDA